MITETLLPAVQAIQTWAESRPWVSRVWIFGSRLRGTQRIDSDLDVAMEIDPIQPDETSFASWMRLHRSWKSELEGRTSFIVDLHQYDFDNEGSKILQYVSCCSSLVYERNKSAT